MEKSNSKKVKKASTKKSSKKEQEPLVVVYADYVNYGEVASILTEKAIRLCMESKEMAHLMNEDGFDYYQFAEVLEEFVDTDMLNELMSSEVGQGILIGIYLMRAAEIRTQEEVERLEGLEDL